MASRAGEDADTHALVTLDAAIVDGPTPPATVSKCDVTTWRIAFCASLAYALRTSGGTQFHPARVDPSRALRHHRRHRPRPAGRLLARLHPGLWRREAVRGDRRLVASSFLAGFSRFVSTGGVDASRVRRPARFRRRRRQVACVFVSSFFSSWLYGAAATYLEGRRTTEVLLAVLSFFLIYAGNLSRGTAALVLEAGCPPLLMPLAIGAVACRSPSHSMSRSTARRRPRPPTATRSKRTR